MGRNALVLSQVLASNYAEGVGEVPRGMRLGSRAVGSENQPTFAAFRNNQRLSAFIPGSMSCEP